MARKKGGVPGLMGKSSLLAVESNTRFQSALFVRLMEPHVNPSTVLGPRLVCLPGPFLEEGVADLPIDMLLLEAVLIRLV